MGKQWKQWLTLFFWAPKSLQMVIAAMKLKDAYSLEEKLWPTQFSSVQSLRCVWLFATPGTAACQGLPVHHQIPEYPNSCPLSWWCHPTISSSVIPCHPLLLLPSIFPSIRIFSNESILPIRRPKYWYFSSSISPSNEYSGLISFRNDWFELAI